MKCTYLRMHGVEEDRLRTGTKSSRKMLCISNRGGNMDKYVPEVHKSLLAQHNESYLS
jgi:hypothetical protein